MANDTYSITLDAHEQFMQLTETERYRIIDAFLHSNGRDLFEEIRGVCHSDATKTAFRWQAAIDRHVAEAMKARRRSLGV